MKTYKVKGFTLIELIVVMAIFSIIMFGAMSLLTPTRKIMTNAENMENGQAAISNIKTYLETELSPVEYMNIISEVGLDPEAEAKSFMNLYYGGVIMPGSLPGGTITYGKGLVHVLQLTNDCQLESWIYQVDYGTNDATLVSHNDSPVNKTYYESFAFELLPGSYPTVEQFDSTKSTGIDDTALNQAFQVLNTTFSIKATTLKTCGDCLNTIVQGPLDTVCPDCGETLRTSGYSFVDNASMALVNMAKHRAGAISGHYFVIDWRHVDDDNNPATPAEDDDGIPGPDTPEFYVADRASQTLNDPAYTAIISAYNAPSFATYSSAPTGGFTFVYSYATEQLQ